MPGSEMFIGEEIRIESFVVHKRLSSKRVRLVAEVNGTVCFVKTFGDPIVQCAVDELKPLVGLEKVGVSRGVTDVDGVRADVLVCRYFPDHVRGHQMPPSTASPEQLTQMLSILWFDVWICNNDRTGTNVLFLPDGKVLPIDESAAFKRASTFRLTPKQPWHERLAPLAEDLMTLLPLPKSVADVLKRTMPKTWPSVADRLRQDALQMPTLWKEFWETAKERVRG